MSKINQRDDVITQITTINVDPDRQDEVLRVMIERAQFMAEQPGFVSISLHRSTDNSHIVNYVQWADRRQLEAAHRSPEFRKRWPEFSRLVQDIEASLYDVVLVLEK